MANIGISKASYFAESSVSKLQASNSNKMQRLASAQNNVYGGDRATFVAMSDTLRLDVAATKAAVKNMAMTQGYLATAMDTLDNASTILAKLQELAVLGANSSNSEADIAAIDAEAEALADRFNDIVQNAQYKGVSVFNDAAGAAKFAVGGGSSISFGIAELYYDELYDHTNPPLNETEPGKTYEIIAPLTAEEKRLIALEAVDVSEEDLVVGARFTTIEPIVLAPNAPPPDPPSDNVLVIRSYAQATSNVAGRLEAAGHNVTIVDVGDNTTIPNDISNYDQVWDLRFLAQYDQQAIDDYDDFVRDGGFLYMVTEHTGFNAQNATKAALITQMGGGNTVIGRTNANNVVVDGQNNTYMTDNLTIDYNAVSSIDNDRGTPLITDSDGDVTAMMWVGNAGDLSNGYSGTVITSPDIEWLHFMTDNNKTALDDIIAGVVRGTVDGTITATGNGIDEDPGVISAAPGKIMLAPEQNMVNQASAGSSVPEGQADNDNDANTAISAVNTSKIELVQQRINAARTLAGAQYAAISSAIDSTTDLTSQYAQGAGTISDVNFTMETAHLAKDQVQFDAASAILAQAGQTQEGLMLLV